MIDEQAVAELSARLSRRERELEAARRVSEAVRRRASLDEIIKAAVLVAVEVVGGEAGSVMLADHERKELVFQVSVGEKPVATGTAIPWTRGIAGQVFHSGQSQVVRDVETGGDHYKEIDALTGFKTSNMFALPLKASDGSPMGVIEVLNKKSGPAEEDLAVLSIIAALTAMAIEQARLFEEARLAEVAHRLGEIGHDIKNMLMPVSVGIDILEKDMPRLAGSPSLREDVTEALTMVKRASRRVQDRVRQITDYVKGHQTKLVFEPCHVAEVVEDVMSTLRLVAVDRRVFLNASQLRELPAIEADRTRLYTAIYNLVDNALAEVSSGGRVTLRGSMADNHVLLTVEDTGRGMAREVRESLFSMKTRSGKRGGTGLGTKIVYDIVTAHGGDVSVESEVGRGTVFVIRLPIKQSPRC